MNRKFIPASDLHIWHILLFHFGLLLIVICYLVGGAFIFNVIEGGNEESVILQKLDQKNESIAKIKQLTKQIINFSLVEAGVNKEEALYSLFDKICQIAADYDIDALNAYGTFDAANSLKRFKRQLNTESENFIEIEQKNWNFSSALLFAFSVVTTIGYGKLFIETTEGKIFCIIYALIGIPIVIMVAANVGKQCLDWILHCIGTTHTFFGKYCCRRTHQIEKLEPLDTSPDKKDFLKVWLLPILVLYIILGAAILPFWESFDEFGAFYFSFMTLSTIGFGNILVPTNYLLLIPTLIYIFIGLGIAVSTFIYLFSDLYKKIYLFGKPTTSVKNTIIRIGSKQMTIEELLNAVGQTLGVPSDEIGALDLETLVQDDLSEVFVKRPERKQEPEMTPDLKPDPVPNSEPEKPKPKPKVRDFTVSRFLELREPTEQEYEAISRPMEEVLPIPTSQPYFNHHPFYLVKSPDVRSTYLAASARCKHCNHAFLSPLLTTNGYKHIAIVHWERYINWGTDTKIYSKENDLKLVMVHPWYHCLVGRYPYFVLDLLKIDEQLLKYDVDTKVVKLLQEQLEIENFSSFQVVPIEEWVHSPV